MVDMTIEEATERMSALPAVNVTHLVLSPIGEALVGTWRDPIGKSLTIRAGRRNRGRIKAYLRKTSR